MKKYNGIINRLVALLCGLTYIFVLIAIPTVAYSTENIDSSSEVILTTESSSGTAETLSSTTGSSSPELTYSIIDPTVPAPATTRIVFDDTNIVDFTFEYEGLTVVKDPNAMIFDLTATSDFGTFEIAADMLDGNVANETIYTYSNGTTVYTSEVSNDTAWHKSKEYEFDNYFLTSEEWHRQYSAISLLFTEEETNYSFSNDAEINEAVNDGKIVVRGRMTWETKNGTVLPMICTKIELRDWVGDESRCLSTTYTDLDGYYCFILDPNEMVMMPVEGLNLFVRTCIESSTFVVLQPYFEGFNYYDSPTVFNVTEETGVVNVSRRIKNDMRFLPYQLTYIQQGMVIGQNFAIDMGMEPDKKLYVFYIGGIEIKNIPLNTALSNFINLIYDNAFCYDTFCFIGYGRHDNFFVPIHEYGHYVENRMGNYGSAVKEHLYECIPDDFNGTFAELSTFIGNLEQVMNDYSHRLNANNFSKTSSLNITKEFQMELTWSEAWATAFAKIAFEQYREAYENSLFVEGVDYETETIIKDVVSEYDGEAHEYAVASFLWDLYDGDPKNLSSDDDSVAWGCEKWWEITTKTGTYTLQDFSNNILDNYPGLINGVGETLSNHRISPEISDTIITPCEFISIKQESTENPDIQIKCTVQGSSSFPNDKFCIAFYDEEYNFIGQTDIVSDPSVSSNTHVHTHTIPKEVWKSIMSHYEGGAIYATVYGYRSGAFDSGPYFSKFIIVWDDNKTHKFEERCDTEGHWDACDCGVTSSDKVAHELTYSYYSLTQHYKKCTECSYIGTANHNFVISGSSSETGHQIVCVCGETRTEAHYAYGYSGLDTSLHNVYCECGYLIGTDFHFWVTTSGVTKCSECGFKKLNGPGNVIMGEDDEDPTAE